VIAVSNRITLVAAQRNDEPPQKQGQIDVTYYPNGTCDAASIVFHGVDKSEALMVMFDPVTAKGTPYPACYSPELVALAMSRNYPAHLAVADNWSLPPGAYKHCGGPS